MGIASSRAGQTPGTKDRLVQGRKTYRDPLRTPFEENLLTEWSTKGILKFCIGERQGRVNGPRE